MSWNRLCKGVPGESVAADRSELLEPCGENLQRNPAFDILFLSLLAEGSAVADRLLMVRPSVPVTRSPASSLAFPVGLSPGKTPLLAFEGE